MEAFRWLLAMLMLVWAGRSKAGGHGGKHHDHVKLHVPEFHHHDHHTKVITIHHHHHKPKKEHHHHHHHVPKPHIPQLHYHHQNKKTELTTHTVKKEHKNHHGHHGHHAHHGHHGHHNHHDYHGHHGHHSHHHDHDQGHHHDVPSYNYEPSSSYDDEFISSYSPPAAPSIPSIPSYTAGIPGYAPQVHGIQHTVKQVKVYDSHPGAIPQAQSNGYEVTEQGEEDEDAFTSVNSLHNTFPATFGYVRAAAPEPVDPFASLTSQGTTQLVDHDPFEEALQSNVGGTSAAQDPFAPASPHLSPASQQFPAEFQPQGIDASSAFLGDDGDVTLVTDEGKSFAENTPVSFSREAGIQETVNNGGVETVLY